MNETVEVQVTDQFGNVNLVFWFIGDDDLGQLPKVMNLAACENLFRIDVGLSIHFGQDHRYFDVHNVRIDENGNLRWTSRELNASEDGFENVNHILPATSFDVLTYISFHVK